jgi:hypothetical protein
LDCCLDDDEVVVVVVVVCTKELESNSNCDLAKSTNNGDGMAGNGLCRTVVNEDEVVDDDGVVDVFLLSFLVVM